MTGLQGASNAAGFYPHSYARALQNYRVKHNIIKIIMHP
jgi:hypothetical protein